MGRRTSGGSGRSQRKHESDDEDESSEDETTLAAFTTSSKKKAGGRAGKGRGSAAPPGTAGGSKLIIPYVGPMKDVEDVELSDPSLGLDKQLEETEHLLKAFEDAVKNHEPLIAKAVAKTEERCAGSKREAVEAATLAAIQTTELRMQSELRAAVADAVAEARAVAKSEQEKAVADAVRATEERCSELQRLAVSNVTMMHQRAVGRPEDVVQATRAAYNFSEAASAADAALAISSQLLTREPQQVVDTKDGALSQPSPSEASNASLQFF